MTDLLTGLVPDTKEQRASRMSEGIVLPAVCMANEEESRVDINAIPTWLKREDQGRRNSCAGNAGTTVLEKIQYMKTGSTRQLSRQFLYAEGQKQCGIRGDNGCKLYGIIKAAETVGCCGEDIEPYGEYRTQFSAAAYEDAKNLRIKTKINPRNYDDYRAAIGGNIGAALLGMGWPIETDGKGYARRYRAGRAGHALALVFLAKTSDANGRPDGIIFNSHLNNQIILVSATFLDELQGQDPFGNQIVTDLEGENIKPRKISWEENPPV